MDGLRRGFVVVGRSGVRVVDLRNLAPRAASLNKRYAKEFGDEFTSLGRKKIIPFIY